MGRERVAILVLVFLLFATFAGWRKSANENKTLQKALENPTIIERPKIVYKELPPHTIIKTVIVEKDKTTTTETTKFDGKTIEASKDEGSIRKAEVPDIKISERRFSLIGTYSIEETWSAGLTYRIFNAVPVEVGVGYHSKDKLQAMALLRF